MQLKFLTLTLILISNLSVAMQDEVHVSLLSETQRNYSSSSLPQEAQTQYHTRQLTQNERKKRTALRHTTICALNVTLLSASVISSGLGIWYDFTPASFVGAIGVLTFVQTLPATSIDMIISLKNYCAKTRVTPQNSENNV